MFLFFFEEDFDFEVAWKEVCPLDLYFVVEEVDTVEQVLVVDDIAVVDLDILDLVLIEMMDLNNFDVEQTWNAVVDIVGTVVAAVAVVVVVAFVAVEDSKLEDFVDSFDQVVAVVAAASSSAVVDT